MNYVWFFIAGALAANGVPAFIKGVMGEKYQMPFGGSSSAMMAVTWGVLNFAVAWWLWRFAMNNVTHVYRYHLAGALGLLVMGWVLATNSGKRG